MKKIKKTLWPIVAIFLIISITLNIKTQFITLKEAKSKNGDLESKIEILKLERNELIRKIEYATSSAFIEQQNHDKLGLGRVGDVWISLSANNKKIDLRPEVNEAKKVSNFEQWLKLFAR